MVALYRLCCIIFCARWILLCILLLWISKPIHVSCFFFCLFNFIYRKAAQKWHPDNFQGDEKKIAEKKFIDIAAAKEVLTDPGKPNFIFKLATQIYVQCFGVLTFYIHSFISIQPWRPGLAGTRAQSCDRYGSGTLHPGQVLGGSLPLLSPALDVPTLAARCLCPQQNERS